MRILIVDDEAGIRKTTRIAVETAGHEAAEVSDGARSQDASSHRSAIASSCSRWSCTRKNTG